MHCNLCSLNHILMWATHGAHPPQSVRRNFQGDWAIFPFSVKSGDCWLTLSLLWGSPISLFTYQAFSYTSQPRVSQFSELRELGRVGDLKTFTVEGSKDLIFLFSSGLVVHLMLDWLSRGREFSVKIFSVKIWYRPEDQLYTQPWGSQQWH